MPFQVTGPDRQPISTREGFSATDIQEMQEACVLILDERRRRPLYFDGRFLAARDLIRDQNYFLTRQADLSRAGGTGVVNGLMVSYGNGPSVIRVSAGQGVTHSGELLVIADDLELDLNDIPTIQRLNAVLGLSQIPAEAPQTRTGLFVVALRSVEFTANPVTAYPTSITGTRSLEDGEIIEGVAVTLIPYRDEGMGEEAFTRRSRIAREIFVLGAEKGLPIDALPLAMVALTNGGIQWIDVWLVRREVGSGRSDIMGLGFAPRALREAHFLQYERQLDELAGQTNRSLRFAASSYFSALPPGGRLPTAAIDTSGNNFTQTFFPPEVDVEISLVPEDEVLALIEESLLLPPIDLRFSGEELESTSVLVLLPVSRARLRTLVNSLTRLNRTLLPAAPGLIARRKPLEALQLIPRFPRPVLTAPTVDNTDVIWRNELANVPFLWYVRRRNLHYRVEVAGLSRPVTTDEGAVERRLLGRIEGTPLEERFNLLTNNASTLARAEIVSLLASPQFVSETASPLLTNAVVHELVRPLELPAPSGPPVVIDRTNVLAVNERFADPQLGEGIARLEATNPELRENAAVVAAVSTTGIVPELDLLARNLPEAELTSLSRELVTLSNQGDTAAITELVTTRVEAIRPQLSSATTLRPLSGGIVR
ncbi:MAG: hypothetical protein K8L91_07665 [Anaerolineae bacterium]|nr:hypothetical protein [Anaerolineae bacterium]